MCQPTVFFAHIDVRKCVVIAFMLSSAVSCCLAVEIYEEGEEVTAQAVFDVVHSNNSHLHASSKSLVGRSHTNVADGVCCEHAAFQCTL